MMMIIIISDSITQREYHASKCYVHIYTMSTKDTELHHRRHSAA